MVTGVSRHQFAGRHLLASYSGCDGAALLDTDALIKAVERAIAASGASLIKTTSHVFAEGGMTATFLLSESHASLHTYPEHNACFVDIFTCGDCRPEQFDLTMQGYLRPRKVVSTIFTRNHEIAGQQQIGTGEPALV